VLVTRNDADSGLFNGDVGLCLADADGRLRAWFDGADGPRALPLGALPAFDLAFALTVHKSQGSEYGEVAVLLPDDPTHRALSRELLYTAASRAKRALALHASSDVIDACLARPVRRSGGLHVRLAEALDGASNAPAPIRIVAAVVSDRSGRVLLVRKRGSATFIQPGGKREAGEDALATLARELREELGVGLVAGSAVSLGRFQADAVNEPGRRVEAEAYAVVIEGEPTAGAEIAELRWLDPDAPWPVPVAPLSAGGILPAWRAARGR
jgi:8-oxo-dGTP pyrophosphatase MutT (NUDIX family)